MNGNDRSLLAHLASRLTTRTETLATEALGYILSQSAAAREALRGTMKGADADVGPLASVKTEVGDEHGGRVDLVAFDEQDVGRVLMEVKFWAGLTEHQPNTYLERLPPASDTARPSVLLFVAPESRLETLWAELARRVAEGRLTDTEPATKHCARVDAGPHRLMLTSWRVLLNEMSKRAATDADPAAERDILQLAALCERQDAEAFLPLRPDEFGPATPRRLLNLRTLVDDATERACAAGFADTSGLKVTPQPYGYGRYLRLGGKCSLWAEAWFGLNYNRWANEQESPLWIHFVDSKKHLSLNAVREKLEATYFFIPLPTGVEYDSVLETVVTNLQWLAEGLAADRSTQ